MGNPSGVITLSAPQVRTTRSAARHGNTRAARWAMSRLVRTSTEVSKPRSLLRCAEQQRTLVGLTHAQSGVAEPRRGTFGDDDLPVLGMHPHVESDHLTECPGAMGRPR